jgi:hypothetical protein
VCKLNRSIHYLSHVCPLICLVRSSNKNLQFPVMVGAVLAKNLQMLVLVSLRFSQTLNSVLFLRGCWKRASWVRNSCAVNIARRYAKLFLINVFYHLTNTILQIQYIGPLFSNATCFDYLRQPSSGRYQVAERIKNGAVCLTNSGVKSYKIVINSNYYYLLSLYLPDDGWCKQSKHVAVLNEGTLY